MKWMKCGLLRPFGDAVCCKEHIDGQKNLYGMRFNTSDAWWSCIGMSGSAKAVSASEGERMIDVINNNSTEEKMIGLI